MSLVTIGIGFDDVLAAAQANAPWAFRRLFEDLSPTVVGYVRLRGATDPEDVTSEAFLSVFRSLETFSGDETAFRSWVFTIVHRRLTDERRRAGRQVRTDPLEEFEVNVGGDVEQEALGRLGSEWVHQVLVDLSADQRDVLLLRVVADLPVDEVADILGKRPGAVRALQHRGLERLRRELGVRPTVEVDRP